MVLITQTKPRQNLKRTSPLRSRATSFLCGSLIVAGLVTTLPAAKADDAVPDWSGFYVGGHIGYAGADWNVEDGNEGLTSLFGKRAGIFDGTVPYSTSFDTSGGLGGGTIGYNYLLDVPFELGIVLIGLESDIGYIDIVEDYERVNGTDVDLASQKYGFYGTVTGRVGVPVNRFLPYVKGGLAIADTKLFGSDFDTHRKVFIDNSDTMRDDKTRTGYAIGGGLEYAVWKGWSVKAEYLFMDFAYSTTNKDKDDWRNNIQMHTVKVGVNVKLDNILGVRLGGLRP